MAETIRIAELANKILDELGKFLKWEINPENDLNFNCLSPIEHFSNEGKKKSKKVKTDEEIAEENHTHPTDIVISYFDPYLNKKVYFNTDLKSYATKSITLGGVTEWLTSLANGTACCRLNETWRQKYRVESNSEIRGLLFVYNHDGEFKKSIYEFIYDFHIKSSDKEETDAKKRRHGVHIRNLNLAPNTYLHILDPLTISRILSIKQDLIEFQNFHKVGLSERIDFPFNYFYPPKQLFKSSVTPKEAPATMELITGPFLIVTFDNYKVVTLDDNDKPNTEVMQGGTIVYYNEAGDTPEEFMYLIETLMMFDLIKEGSKTFIKQCFNKPSINAFQNFENAITQYCNIWDYSDSMKSVLENIQFSQVTLVQRIFCNKAIDRSTKS
ncbi:hypothetical protein C0159_01685 [Moraxella catarrhalis]|uniref:GAPS4 PD-(D/E)XK nuclease domain-containing protein n=1 Tax=Moraxella catarrhalis TaxID=480 RepID=A0ABY0BKG8_MORCA|nr:hypothetical protein [Moraxella catarrhalis]AXT95633.1 hypothetical protein SQ00_08405 [Moraxella catarrhalis]EGE21782.1 hypothetical protein E9S_01959 [Moraxella catarrhalis BC7]MDE4519963.1 hypothetical protein [Moraxella catarrhalis]MPW50473.1 hypothetical protein [Moraxella catarrhalis]MPW51628.1 hypothetical protein [Moraxella catarrhalis]